MEGPGKSFSSLYVRLQSTVEPDSQMHVQA